MRKLLSSNEFDEAGSFERKGTKPIPAVRLRITSSKKNQHQRCHHIVDPKVSNLSISSSRRPLLAPEHSEWEHQRIDADPADGKFVWKKPVASGSNSTLDEIKVKGRGKGAGGTRLWRRVRRNGAQQGDFQECHDDEAHLLTHSYHENNVADNGYNVTLESTEENESSQSWIELRKDAAILQVVDFGGFDRLGSDVSCVETEATSDSGESGGSGRRMIATQYFQAEEMMEPVVEAQDNRDYLRMGSDASLRGLRISHGTESDHEAAIDEISSEDQEDMDEPDSSDQPDVDCETSDNEELSIYYSEDEPTAASETTIDFDDDFNGESCGLETPLFHSDRLHYLSLDSDYLHSMEKSRPFDAFNQTPARDDDTLVVISDHSHPSQSLFLAGNFLSEYKERFQLSNEQKIRPEDPPSLASGQAWDGTITQSVGQGSSETLRTTESSSELQEVKVNLEPTFEETQAHLEEQLRSNDDEALFMVSWEDRNNEDTKAEQFDSDSYEYDEGDSVESPTSLKRGSEEEEKVCEVVSDRISRPVRQDSEFLASDDWQQQEDDTISSCSQPFGSFTVHEEAIHSIFKREKPSVIEIRSEAYDESRADHSAAFLSEERDLSSKPELAVNVSKSCVLGTIAVEESEGDTVDSSQQIGSFNFSDDADPQIFIEENPAKAASSDVSVSDSDAPGDYFDVPRGNEKEVGQFFHWSADSSIATNSESSQNDNGLLKLQNEDSGNQTLEESSAISDSGVTESSDEEETQFDRLSSFWSRPWTELMADGKVLKESIVSEVCKAPEVSEKCRGATPVTNASSRSSDNLIQEKDLHDVDLGIGGGFETEKPNSTSSQLSMHDIVQERIQTNAIESITGEQKAVQPVKETISHRSKTLFEEFDLSDLSDLSISTDDDIESRQPQSISDKLTMDDNIQYGKKSIELSVKDINHQSSENFSNRYGSKAPVVTDNIETRGACSKTKDEGMKCRIQSKPREEIELQDKSLPDDSDVSGMEERKRANSGKLFDKDRDNCVSQRSHMAEELMKVKNNLRKVPAVGNVRRQLDEDDSVTHQFYHHAGPVHEVSAVGDLQRQLEEDHTVTNQFCEHDGPVQEASSDADAQRQVDEDDSVTNQFYQQEGPVHEASAVGDTQKQLDEDDSVTNQFCQHDGPVHKEITNSHSAPKVVDQFLVVEENDVKDFAYNEENAAVNVECAESYRSNKNEEFIGEESYENNAWVANFEECNDAVGANLLEAPVLSNQSSKCDEAVNEESPHNTSFERETKSPKDEIPVEEATGGKAKGTIVEDSTIEQTVIKGDSFCERRCVLEDVVESGKHAQEPCLIFRNSRSTKKRYMCIKKRAVANARSKDIAKFGLADIENGTRLGIAEKEKASEKGIGETSSECLVDHDEVDDILSEALKIVAKRECVPLNEVEDLSLMLDDKNSNIDNKEEREISDTTSDVSIDHFGQLKYYLSPKQSALFCSLIAKSKPMQPKEVDMDDHGRFEHGEDTNATDMGEADAGEINEGEIEAGEIEAGEIEAGEIEAGEIEAGEIEAGEIEAGEIEAGEIEAGEIEAGEIEADEIEADEIEADEIEADEIEADEIEADEIEADEIEANDIEANEIEADEIDADEIDANEIDAGETGAGEIDAACDLPTRSMEMKETSLTMGPLAKKLFDENIELAESLASAQSELARCRSLLKKKLEHFAMERELLNAALYSVKPYPRNSTPPSNDEDFNELIEWMDDIYDAGFVLRPA